MRTRASLIGLGLALLAMSAAAQTVTGSGTTNTVPVFTGTSTVGNSPITVSGGNVGIGTTSPNATLEIQPVEGNAQLRLDQPNWKGGFGFTVKDDGNLYIDRYGTQIMTMQMNGAVGIGTTAPAYKLDVAGPIHSSTGGIVFPDGTTQTTANANVLSGTNQITQVGGNVGIGTTTPNTSLSVYIPANSVGSLYPIVTGQVNGPTTVGGMYGTYDQSTPYGGGLAFQIYKPNVGLIEGMRVSSAGNVG